MKHRVVRPLEAVCLTPFRPGRHPAGVCLTRFFTFVLSCALGAVVSACSGGTLGDAKDVARRSLPGGKALGMNEALLGQVHTTTSERAPAAIRPDPDTYIRNLLRQYREEGPVIAQEIGRVEDYRPLLGGANEDFSKAPQLTYDSTSLLAVQKVSAEICEGLVAPTSRHEGWASILPAAPDSVEANLRFLAQRFIGLPSAQIGDDVIAALREILDVSTENGRVTYQSYIPVCVALTIDAEALYL